MALTQVDQGLLGTYAQYTGFKNRLINGSMLIDQRNAGASVTASTTSTSVYTLDRWNYYAVQASKFTVQQNAGSVTPPAGFTKYLGVTSSSAYTVLTGEEFSINQSVEGLNITDLGWGAVGAASVTLSFWVRSSLTGTFGGTLRNSGGSRSYPYSYTISSANTWEQKTITIAGDTSGTWLTTNGQGILLGFSLGTAGTAAGTAGAWASSNYTGVTGQVNVVGTSGATFYITGVQLEKGSTATSFDYRPYGTELALCQRYLPNFAPGASGGVIGLAQAYASNNIVVTIMFPVFVRVPPTGIVVSSASHFSAWNATTSGAGTASSIAFNQASLNSGSVVAAGWSSNNLAAGNISSLYSGNSAAQIYFTGCEL